MQLRAGCTTGYKGGKHSLVVLTPKNTVKDVFPACILHIYINTASHKQRYRRYSFTPSGAPSHPCLHSECAVPPGAPWSHGCKLPAMRTSTHQHAPPVTAHLSLHLCALTLSLCSQTQRFTSVLWYRQGTQPSCLLDWLCRCPTISATLRTSIPHWIPSAPTVFLSG